MALVQVDRDFAMILDDWLHAITEAGLRVRFTSGFRTAAKQRAIFARLGKRGLAARPGRSFHEVGLAADFVTIPRTRDRMQAAGEIAEELGLRWGGRFRTPDPVHLDAGTLISIGEAHREGFPFDLVEVSE